MEGERVSVSFTCQRCLQPVILDDSFTNMDDYARAELARKNFRCINFFVIPENKQIIMKQWFIFCSANLCKH